MLSKRGKQTSKHEQYFQERFQELCAYKEANGDCRVPQRYEENKKLGRWVTVMRRYYKEQGKKQNPVWKKRFGQLEAVGFEWEVHSWPMHLNELREYKEANGHCRVPLQSTKNKKLGYFVALMRSHYKNNKMQQDPVWRKRFAQLEALGFEWEVNSWQMHLNELREYKEANGHCRVPLQSAKNKTLGNWVNQMRCNYKNDFMKQDPVCRKRFAQLEAVGFEWEVSPNKWQERLNELREYKEANGDCRVPAKYEKNKKLANWVSNMRCHYRDLEKKENPVWKNRFAQLEALGFEWAITFFAEDVWQERCEELRLYKETNGHCRVPVKYEENKTLGHWVATMRRYYREHDKKQDPVWKNRFAQLEALGFEWEVIFFAEDVWQERFEELRLYKETNGDCRVPVKYEKNKKLGSWARLMRRYYKNNKMQQDPAWKKRFAQLEALGFEWEVIFFAEDVWQERFEELRLYKETNGDCRVP
eukprot:CAMPEP_0113642290 /NCGR_PEP_ID=MMETSP0017_2-20120614/22215_1 /TAXON_ID=2856 /ORGANISM="Cylindrotheca closterium" /LENGTH=473 /DNA_ID=CAMNT_0000553703 /DNA_START=154 /DNA_END=1571 /DNA_ORIENTATION=- /assembly_acc=CAM_ASM_000147